MNDKQPTTSTTRVRTRRDVLRRRRRERQILFFGVLIIALGAVAYNAAEIYAGRAVSPFATPIYTPEGDAKSDINLACPPDTLPLDPKRVVVRVLNSTETAGLAGNVLSTLTGRGFVSGGATNWSRGPYEDAVRISYGSEGVAEAYTVARHFVGVEMVQDTRPGHSVDVVLGAKFNEVESVRPQFAPELDAKIPLSANAQCIPPAQVNEEPAPRVVPPELEPLEPEPSASAGSEPTGDDDGVSD